MTVTLIAELPLPATMVCGEAVTVDRMASTASAVTVTIGCCVRGVPLPVAVMVLVPATVELSAPVATPLESVMAGCVMMLPLPFADRETATPLIGWPLPSRTVTVIAEALDPLLAVMGEAAVTLDRVAEGTGVMLNAADKASVSVPEVAWSVYPVPASLMLKLPNVATPATALTVVVPASVPLPGLVPMASVTLLVAFVTRLPEMSWISTLTAGIVAPAAVLTGWTKNPSCAGEAVMLKAF